MWAQGDFTVKRYFVIARLFTWDSIEIEGGNGPKLNFPKCPFAFMPVFETRKQAEKWDKGNGDIIEVIEKPKE